MTLLPAILHTFTSISIHAQATATACTLGTTPFAHNQPHTLQINKTRQQRYASVTGTGNENKSHRIIHQRNRSAHKRPFGGFGPSETPKKRTVSELEPPKQNRHEPTRGKYSNAIFSQTVGSNSKCEGSNDIARTWRSQPSHPHPPTKSRFHANREKRDENALQPQTIHFSTNSPRIPAASALSKPPWRCPAAETTGASTGDTRCRQRHLHSQVSRVHTDFFCHSDPINIKRSINRSPAFPSLPGTTSLIRDFK